jgi:ferrochelatase
VAEAPAVPTNCLETIEEIGEENAGIQCLNASDGGMRVIENIVCRELRGWI